MLMSMVSHVRELTPTSYKTNFLGSKSLHSHLRPKESGCERGLGYFQEPCVIIAVG